MDDLSISLIVFIELLFDCINAAILAEYEVNKNNDVINSIEITIRIASESDL